MKNIFKTSLLTLSVMTLLDLIGCISYKKAPRRALIAASYIKPLDAVIVPGVPFKNGSWDSIMKARVIWAYILYKDGYTRNVIFSGSAVYSPYYEGIIMSLYAEQLGIPKSRIFYETKARHSTENIFYSYLLAMHHGFKSIGLATDPVQSSLLKSFTRKRFKTHIYHLPFVTDSVARYNHLAPIIDPAPAEAADNFVSITDNESFWQRLRGTLGKGINWSKYPGHKLGEL